eukprot:comp22278_c0_seq1/m.32971 comp22278_c0_seq1/g.32971  ORF comp22278_c0_seq1/g.32971 comp22278_c0_seq1/m.32971 type:complete len:654 (-) comp22278_c0_seq1:315-2276(-)
MTKKKKSQPITSQRSNTHKPTTVKATPKQTTSSSKRFAEFLGGEDYVGALIAHWEAGDPLCIRAQRASAFSQLPKLEAILHRLDDKQIFFGKDVVATKWNPGDKNTEYGQYHGVATKEGVQEKLSDKWGVQFSNLDRRFTGVSEVLGIVDGFWAGEGGCDMTFHAMGDECYPFPPALLSADIIILQREGEQNIKLFEVESLSDSSLNTDRGHHPSTILPSLNVETEPVLEVTLAPGDILLVPKRLALVTDCVECEDGSLDAWVHLSGQVSWGQILDRAISIAEEAFEVDENTRFFGRRMAEGEEEEEEEEEEGEENENMESVGQIKLAGSVSGKTVNRSLVKDILKVAMSHVGTSLKMIGQERTQWNRTHFNTDGKYKDFNLEKLLEENGGLVKIPNFLPAELAERLLQVFETITEDEWEMTVDQGSTDYFKSVAHAFYSTKDFPTSHAILDMFRNVLPDRAAVFSAGKYLQSHFIDEHDDRAYKVLGGKTHSRDIAFIYYLTKDWTEEMGGLLTDVEGDGKSYVPEFNSAIAFRVPRYHVVTPVTCDRPRFSIFGWFMQPGEIYDLKYEDSDPPTSEESAGKSPKAPEKSKPAAQQAKSGQVTAKGAEANGADGSAGRKMVEKRKGEAVAAAQKPRKVKKAKFGFAVEKDVD